MTKSVSQFCLLTAVVAIMLSGCASYPTEQAAVLDNRPQISFATSKDGSTMSVYVDGIANGVVSDYVPGESALRVLPGTHTISVKLPDGSTFTQRIYVSDGVTKTVVLP